MPNPAQTLSIAAQTWANEIDAIHGNVWTDEERAELVLSISKLRYVIYTPMILLPSGSFTSTTWVKILGEITEDDKQRLWKDILEAIRKAANTTATHLAVNEGIPLHQTSHSDTTDGIQTPENILRSPSKLRVLHGEFGPSTVLSPSPTQSDFDAAFWVTTKQNGIQQTWAPRWTMFSRGNIKEKARLLGFHSDKTYSQIGPQYAWDMAARTKVTPAQLRDGWAVDLYGGIGYFVFSYVKMGMRVLTWELNPWSVEGMRRGAEMNGWGIRVVRGADLERSWTLSELLEPQGGKQVRIVVFEENNEQAGERIEAFRTENGLEGDALLDDVLHVNCGLLPTSESVWRDAQAILQHRQSDGWLHLHENVAAEDIADRRGQIQQLTNEQCVAPKRAVVEHVERVKTYAPGVWHCVFDVLITSQAPFRWLSQADDDEIADRDTRRDHEHVP